MPFDFLDRIEELSEKNLTIREQARIAENPLELRYPSIFPVQPVLSLKVAGMRLLDHRPAGGRRDWNAQGREIPERVGPTIEAEIAPINPTKHLDEKRLTELKAASQGVAELVNRGVIADASAWPTRLVDAAERNLEAEAFEAWATGTITAIDTKSNDAVAIALPIDPARYVVEATPWNDASVDAYDLFLARVETALVQLGSVGGVRMRRASAKAILANAPAQSDGVRATLASLEQRINDDLGGGSAVRLVIDERTYDAFTNGSTTTTLRWYVPAEKLLFQPSDGVVGATLKGPVARAYDFLPAHVIAAGGVQNVATFRTPKNDGKTLLIEAQENAAAIPDEGRVFVVDIGV